MSWVLLDDDFPNHPKTVQAGADAALLFVFGLCYCRKHSTGGFLSQAAVMDIMRPKGSAKAFKAAQSLVTVGYWSVARGGWKIEPNPLYRLKRKRQSLSHLRPKLAELHGDQCAYCGACGCDLEVEHVIPVSRGGSDHISNLRLACISCNRAKGALTAAEFGHGHIQKAVF